MVIILHLHQFIHISMIVQAITLLILIPNFRLPSKLREHIFLFQKLL